MKKEVKITRRQFNKVASASGLALTLKPNVLLSDNSPSVNDEEEYDYIVVGSGAGGGPLAANLARSGFRVLVLEAGAKDAKTDNYKIPAYHAFASEDKDLSWHYYVKHYSNGLDKKDSKYVPGKGIFYPRGATIGGSTAVNAMITVYPHASDFEYIAKLTGDKSWEADTMRNYLSYIESCEYLNYFQSKAQRHGVLGWLPTNYYNFDLVTLLENSVLLSVINANLEHNDSNLLEYLVDKNKFDVNNLSFHKGGTGPVSIPQTMNKNAVRHSVREYLLTVQKWYPRNLYIRTNALVSKVLFDEDKKAIGVEYFEGKNTYNADPLYSKGNSYKTKVVKAKREVIISAGAFNTPQILQLSGIGDENFLKSKNIPVVKHLPGVGKNLQDRYELGVTYELTKNVVESCKFGEGFDHCLNIYNLFATGAYTSNGAVVANIIKSDKNLKDPDLFNFCLLSDFKGYFPNYSNAIKINENKITWAILKGHTSNVAGEVKIKDSDPTSAPDINFKYFSDGKDFKGNDMEALIKGVKNIRAMMNRAGVKKNLKREVWPGENIKTDEDLRDFISKETWGHHASCSCKIGVDSDKDAVLDSDFKVKGFKNLRVVDASVFPKIPGFFIAVPIYLISEKATDVILKDAGVKRGGGTLSTAISDFKKKREDDLKNRISVKPYPNPFKDQVTFSIKHPDPIPSEKLEISIFDSSNRSVYLKEFPFNKKIKINLNDLPSGIYIYIVKMGTITKYGKIVKQ